MNQQRDDTKPTLEARRRAPARGRQGHAVRSRASPAARPASAAASTSCGCGRRSIASIALDRAVVRAVLADADRDEARARCSRIRASARPTRSSASRPASAFGFEVVRRRRQGRTATGSASTSARASSPTSRAATTARCGKPFALAGDSRGTGPLILDADPTDDRRPARSATPASRTSRTTSRPRRGSRSARSSAARPASPRSAISSGRPITRSRSPTPASISDLRRANPDARTTSNDLVNPGPTRSTRSTSSDRSRRPSLSSVDNFGVRRSASRAGPVLSASVLARRKSSSRLAQTSSSGKQLAPRSRRRAARSISHVTLDALGKGELQARARRAPPRRRAVECGGRGPAAAHRRRARDRGAAALEPARRSSTSCSRPIASPACSSPRSSTRASSRRWRRACSPATSSASRRLIRGAREIHSQLVGDYQEKSLVHLADLASSPSSWACAASIASRSSSASTRC